MEKLAGLAIVVFDPAEFWRDEQKKTELKKWPMQDPFRVDVETSLFSSFDFARRKWIRPIEEACEGSNEQAGIETIMTSSSGKSVYLLTGDIGGTNSRMSLYDASDASAKPKVVHYYRNAEHLPQERLGDADAFPMHIIVPFLELCWSDGDAHGLAALEQSEIVACIATAGVVSNNRAYLTNLGNLLIDGTAIQSNKSNKYLKRVLRCLVINDFVAQGKS